mmetsp:Transcript_75570/g.179561  ORF Transcript_75570/g.179561 Transcript_75570/m.179561 type:complete len:366 (-) Transcript_75570:74-1171(-)
MQEYANYDAARRQHAQQDRYTRAVRAIHGSDGDPLMRRGNQVVSRNSRNSAELQEKARGWVLVLIFTLVSFAFYGLMMLMWYVVYYHSLEFTVIMLILLLLAAGAMIAAGARDLSQPLTTFKVGSLTKNRRWLVFLGILCLFATVLGTIVGFFAYFNKLVFYNSMSEMRTYTNVGASQSKSMVSDGGIFLFSEDSRLDSMRSVGFQSRWTGRTVCVAPIVDTGMGSGDDINFWAVGQGCCGSRAQFQCDDSQDFTVSSALVVLRAEDVVRPIMRWAVASSADPVSQYMEAIRLQEAVYFTHSAPDPIFVRWVKDPIAFKDKYLRDARLILGVTSLLFFLFTVVAAYFITFRVLYPIKVSKGMPVR